MCFVCIKSKEIYLYYKVSLVENDKNENNRNM